MELGQGVGLGTAVDTSHLTPSGVNISQYRKKVEQFLRDHEDYWVIHKIRWAIPLEPRDLAALEDFFYRAEAVGGWERFVQVYGRQENLAAFIRKLVGLDRKAAKEKFAAFRDGRTFTVSLRPTRFVLCITSLSIWRPMVRLTRGCCMTSRLRRFITEGWTTPSRMRRRRRCWK